MVLPFSISSFSLTLFPQVRSILCRDTIFNFESSSESLKEKYLAGGYERTSKNSEKSIKNSSLMQTDFLPTQMSERKIVTDFKGKESSTAITMNRAMFSFLKDSSTLEKPAPTYAPAIAESDESLHKSKSRSKSRQLSSERGFFFSSPQPSP